MKMVSFIIHDCTVEPRYKEVSNFAASISLYFFGFFNPDKSRQFFMVPTPNVLVITRFHCIRQNMKARKI